MKKIIRSSLALLLLLSAFSCVREMQPEEPMRPSVPDGTPATLCIGFGSGVMDRLVVSTRAEASASEEARIHDVYVMIFDNKDTLSGSPKKIYGRYFSHEHLTSDLAALDANPNEGWWVENKTMDGVTPAVTKTTGVVKVSTQTCTDATLVLLANVSNSVTTFGGDDDDIAYLNAIEDLGSLRKTKVILEQNVVQRKDLFLMVADTTVANTADMIWGTLPRNYDSDYTLHLRAVDAKVKFLVKYNPANISNAKAVYWKVCNTPDRCYLFSDYNGGAAPDDVVYFESQTAYFEGMETVDGEEWYAFTFYMFENRQAPKQHATRYHDREKQQKIDTGESGYQGGGNYVKNGEWVYADPHAAYVKFDMVLTLTPTGILAMGGGNVGNALTSDTIFAVHLGDFGSSGSASGHSGYDDYNTLRSHFYTYKITIDNSGSIYAEVENDNERQPGQEGFLLLTNDEIVNADAHYEYHSITFNYNQNMSPELFSWYVKTPFGEGGPEKTVDPDNPDAYLYKADDLDYKWVKFAINEIEGGEYATHRMSYPGEDEYDPDWKPSLGTAHPTLMDINQLIEYIFDQTDKQTKTGSSDFVNQVIRATIFIDEYYYEKDPLNPDAAPDPNLWREFVNAQPREMHILSDARKSRDRASDVILSSHSIIQQSIQSIYNTYAPGLRSLWGCEHKDEIKEKVPDGWTYSGTNTPSNAKAGADNDLGRENGRLNTGYIWGTYSKNDATGADINNKEWVTFMNFEVDNNMPELKDDYHGLAWSCLTRNRDNNGNGKIDRNEVRWYMASARQLIGMWVGNESLSLSARLYQPNTGQWRAHVMSSTDRMVCWAEEGGGSTKYDLDYTQAWDSMAEAAKGESVRCVRNVGTYDGNDGVTDVSEAPYTFVPDRYFELEDNGDGSYTYIFDRLNSKSIREFTEDDLPYHAQNSLINRVYVKMITSKVSEQLDDINVKIKDINPEVTRLGYNPYCPAGYRFPNHTEMVLMSLYLPSSYFKKDKDGNDYSGGRMMPTRTYYDRGYYGNLKGGPWDATEGLKVGWALSTGDSKQHCYDRNTSMTQTRCVKDSEMTGSIMGEINVADQYIYADDWTPVNLNFASTGSAFTASSLKLCYTAHSGNYREIDIPVKAPSGLEYRETQTVIIPSLAQMGLEESDIPVSMTLEAQVKNLAGKTKTVSAPVTLEHPLLAENMAVEFPNTNNVTRGVPIRVKMAIGGHSLKFASATLEWKEHGGSWQSKAVEGLDPDFHREYSEDIWLEDLIGASDFADTSFLNKSYSYKLTVTAENGLSVTTPVRSMQIVQWGIHPNSNVIPEHPWQDSWWFENDYANAKAWHNALVGNAPGCVGKEQSYVINQTWPKQQVTDLDFAGGDAIEVNLDVSDCTFIRTVDGDITKAPYKNQMIGLDNIFAVGKDRIDGQNGSKDILFYYPAHVNNADLLQIDANPGWKKIQLSSLNGDLVLLLNKDAFYYNGNRINWSEGVYTTAFNIVTSSTSLWIGAEEGDHHTRALCRYARVIRERDY